MADVQPGPAKATGPTRRLALSRAEAAEALGISIDFFDKHISYEVRAVRRGRRRLYPITELERWLADAATLALDDQPTNERTKSERNR